MSNTKPTFVEQCLQGEALLDDVDDAIERWHQGDATCSLEEYLGLTPEEYAVFVEKPDALGAIVHSRRYNSALVDALEWIECPSLAARAKSQTEEKQILQWLKKTKRIP